MESIASLTGDFEAPRRAAVAVAVLGAVGLAALLRVRARLSGTTLVAPWRWSLVALAAVAGTELAIALSASAPLAWISPWRFVAATSTFTPAMALFGAKRPQARGWQAIVASLWLVLSLPAIKWLLYGGFSELHAAQLGFLFILLASGALNGIGTRAWPASLAYAAGQAVLIVPLVWPETPLGKLPATAGLGAIVASLIMTTFPFPPTARPRGWDRAWLDFRDAFGVVWSLRIMERMNASARMYGWPTTLGWRGFVAGAADQPADITPAIEDSFRTLLRRFVSPQWIDARVAPPAPRAEPAGE